MNAHNKEVANPMLQGNLRGLVIFSKVALFGRTVEETSTEDLSSVFETILTLPAVILSGHAPVRLQYSLAIDTAFLLRGRSYKWLRILQAFEITITGR